MIELDVATHEIHVGPHRRKIVPTLKEFLLLKHLAEARGKVLSRADLLAKVWGQDRGARVDTRTVDQHVSRLRRQLGEHSKVIETRANVGYRGVGIRMRSGEPPVMLEVLEVEHTMGKKPSTAARVRFSRLMPTLLKGAQMEIASGERGT